MSHDTNHPCRPNGLTRLQCAIERFRREVELSREQLTEREWRVLLDMGAIFVARENARQLDDEWRRAA